VILRITVEQIEKNIIGGKYMNKPISTKVHGMVDYGTAGLLLSAPLIFGYDLDSPEAMVPMSLGVMTIGASAMTDYEMGFTPLMSMKAHLALDVMNGLFLAASPFIFGFKRKSIGSWLPHVLLGIGEIMTAMMTQTTPSSHVGQPAPTVHGRTKLEGYQPRSSRSTSQLQGVH
jgi:hypothetical protein